MRGFGGVCSSEDAEAVQEQGVDGGFVGGNYTNKGGGQVGLPGSDTKCFPEFEGSGSV